MYKNTIYQVDAFTAEPFKGNPAGVMLVDEGMTAGRMQRIAAEMNLSETAFSQPRAEGFAIRYFTPLRKCRCADTLRWQARISFMNSA